MRFGALGDQRIEDHVLDFALVDKLALARDDGPHVFG